MGDGWDERNWDAVRRQEQKKQEILVQASKNSEKIRKMVRQVEETKTIGAETLSELDKQSGNEPRHELTRDDLGRCPQFDHFIITYIITIMLVRLLL